MAYRFDSFYIGGAWVKPRTTDVLTLENPATRDPFATVPDATPADAVAAIEAAASALPAWSATPLAKRVELMQKALEIFKTYRDEIIRLEALELGAPVSYSANAHCDYQFTRIESYIRESQKVVLEEQFEQSTVVREPVGVIACITPWNYPLGQVVQKIIPALLMGNTVVLKPSQHTPLTAYLLVDSLDRAGFPAGTVNLVTGRGSKLGDTFATHPLVDMISFTGSTAVGIKLSQKALESVKRISLELGGKSPFIWLPSEDYEPAINQLFGSVFYNSGQTCTALTRLLVPESDLERVKALLLRRIPQLVVGDPMDPKTNIGPMASKAQYDKVLSYIELGQSEGAELLCGGPAPEAGNVYVNGGPRDVTAPFGGYKQSGIGREGGRYGLMEFTQLKATFDR